MTPGPETLNEIKSSARGTVMPFASTTRARMMATLSKPDESFFVSEDKIIFSALPAVRSSSVATTFPFSFRATAFSVPGANGIFQTRGDASRLIVFAPRVLPFRNNSTCSQFE